MKKLLTALLLSIGCAVYAQNAPNMIDFEDGGFLPQILCPSAPHTPGLVGMSANGTPYPEVDNTYFQCNYGVQFFVQPAGSSSLFPAYYAQIGNGVIEGFHAGHSQTYTSTSSGGCSVSSGGDRPIATTATNGLDVGCWFLTTTGQHGSGNSSLVVQYDPDVQCLEASGIMLDIDYSEGWHIQPFDAAGNPIPNGDRLLLASGVTHALQATVPQLASATGDGVPSWWECGNPGSGIPIASIEFEYIGGGGAGVAFDHFFMCENVGNFGDSSGCCEGINMIENGTFDMGNANVNSDYSEETSFSAGSVGPGEFGIVNSTEAGQISAQWAGIEDHTSCPDDLGEFMVVNGRTMGSGSAIVYEQTQITVDEESEYVFCMYYQHLPQCEFDVFDPGNIDVQFIGADATLNGCEDEGDDCGWTKLSWSLEPTGTTLDIEVHLDETGIGDGNDVAFDDFTLKEKLAMPAGYAHFNVQSFGTTSPFQFQGQASVPNLPAGFEVTWTVEKIDCNTELPISGWTMSDTTWDDDTTFFEGYCCTYGSTTPGSFNSTECYRITRTVTHCCYEDDSWSWKFESGSRPAPGGGRQDIWLMSDDNGAHWQEVPNGDAPVSEQPEQHQMLIYPNPGDGSVWLQSEQLNGSTITIYNSESRLVKQLTHVGSENQILIDLSDVPNGVYLIRMDYADGLNNQQTYMKQ